MKKICLVLLFMFVSVCSVSAATKPIGLLWDSNIEVDIAGYEVYIADESMPSNCPDTGTFVKDVIHGEGDTQTTEIILVWEDGQGKVYYIKVLAYDTSDNKSECSNEVLQPVGDMEFVSRTITLEWDSNTEEDIAGYEVYMREVAQACAGIMMKDVAHQVGIDKQTTEIQLVWAVGTTQTFYISLLAYDTSENKSECCDDVSTVGDDEAPEGATNFIAE